MGETENNFPISAELQNLPKEIEAQVADLKNPENLNADEIAELLRVVPPLLKKANGLEISLTISSENLSGSRKTLLQTLQSTTKFLKKEFAEFEKAIPSDVRNFPKNTTVFRRGSILEVTLPTKSEAGETVGDRFWILARNEDGKILARKSVLFEDLVESGEFTVNFDGEEDVRGATDIEIRDERGNYVSVFEGEAKAKPKVLMKIRDEMVEISDEIANKDLEKITTPFLKTFAGVLKESKKGRLFNLIKDELQNPQENQERYFSFDDQDFVVDISVSDERVYVDFKKNLGGNRR
jgi:hypothetical protein